MKTKYFSSKTDFDFFFIFDGRKFSEMNLKILKCELVWLTDCLAALPAGLLVLTPSLWVRLVQLQAAALIGCCRVKSSGSKVS